MTNNKRQSKRVTQKDKARVYDLLNIYYNKPQKFKDAIVVARCFK